MYSQPLSLPLVSTTVPHHEQEAKQRGMLYLHHATSLCLPLLLLLQFAITFHAGGTVIDGLRWPVVSMSTAIFTLASLLYHKAVADAGVGNVAAKLFPDCIVVTVVAIIFFRHFMLAYIVLVGGVLSMALTIACCTLYVQFVEPGKEELKLSRSHYSERDAFVV